MVVAVLCFTACGRHASQQKASGDASPLPVVHFDADSAYHFVEEQVSMGPRVPGTEAHRRTADYVVRQLARFGADTIRQHGTAYRYDGQRIEMQNLIGIFNPQATRRIMLCAHWDSRPWADQEADASAMHTPVPAANDGASGVGILLEVARQLGNTAPAIGVDIIMFDAEDAGTPAFESYRHDENTWCLGSQYWARNPHKAGYRAQYAILLDMVGAEGATFPREYFSTQYAPGVVDKVWRIAAQLGYADMFVNRDSHPITDDHYFVNQLAHIPCIDIVHYDADRGHGFFEQWHTTHDDMSHISRRTLAAVGHTLVTTLMSE